MQQGRTARLFTTDEHLDSPGYSSITNIDQFREYLHVHSCTIPNHAYHYYDGEESNLDTWYSDPQNLQIGDFSYSFNELGFRDKPYSTDVDVCYYGCSNTVGIGVNKDGMWTALVDRALGTTSNNLGITGASIQEIAQCFVMSTAFTSMRRAVFLLPDATRHTLPVPVDTAHACYARLYSNYEHDDHITAHFKRSYQQLIASYYSLPDLFFADKLKQELSLICLAARLQGIEVFLSTWSTDPYMLRLLEATGARTIKGMDNDGQGRDGMHPGLRAHARFADQVMDALR